MDEEMRKKVERRAQEILDEDPKERDARFMRHMAEKIAWAEIRAEENAAAQPRADEEAARGHTETAP